MVISIRRLRNQDSKNVQSKWINLNHLKSWNAKHYQLKDLMNQTDSIQIYHGDHISTNHPVVIKMTNLDSEDFLDSVCHEIESLTKLKHVNILPMLATFVSGNYLWNVVAHAEMGSVDLWSRPYGLPELAIAFIIKDVLLALDYLHKRGIIHRAVCCSHILLNSNGSCMLTGLKYSTTVVQNGRWQRCIHQYPKNATNLLNYMAPEILEQNLLGYNSKSDLYSVGVVCCELANGCTPFQDLVLTEMLLDKLMGNFPRPLDSTSEEIRNFPNEEDLSSDVKEKINLYKNRTFSSSFHIFTVDLCLNFDSCLRPMASELLNNNFIKQTKKSHQNLIELLQQITSSSSSFASRKNNESCMVINNDVIRETCSNDDQVLSLLSNSLIESEKNKKEDDVRTEYTADWIF